MKLKVFALSLLLMATLDNGTLHARQILKSVFTEKSPTIDGVLDDACWADMEETAGYTDIASGGPAHFRTFVKSRFDGKYLFLAFRCEEKQADLRDEVKDRDGAVWFDSSVELFIAPDRPATVMESVPGEGDRFFHLAFNPLGTQFDQIGASVPWDGQWMVKCNVKDSEWTAEVIIPFADVYVQDTGRPQSMTMWKIQFGRSAFGDNQQKHEISSLFGAKGVFRNRANFGDLVFVNDLNTKNLRWEIDRQQVIQPAMQQSRATLERLNDPSNDSAKEAIRKLGNDIKAFEDRFNDAGNLEYEAHRDEIIEATKILKMRVREFEANAVMRKAQQIGARVATAPHPAIRDELAVKPDFIPALDSIGRPLRLALTPSEFEPASFVIWSDQPLRNLMVAIDTPADAAGSQLLHDSIDCRWVKCWYQGGAGDILFTGKVLTPELLLHDPDMVRVDYKTEQNILKERPVPLEDRTFAKAYPDDADTLLPIEELDGGIATQVWLTAHVPSATKPGRYVGKIRITADEKPVAELDVEVDVLDFELRPSMMQHAQYTNSWWGERYYGTRERAQAEIRNMVDHGVTHVLLRETLAGVADTVALMREGGMQTDRLYIGPDGGDWGLSETTSPEYAYEQAAKWVAIAKELGIDEIYLYMIDEARDFRLMRQRPLVEQIHRAGAKTFVACYSDYFPLAGDMIDAPIIAHGPVAVALVKKIHDRGSRVYCYSNPQGGVEQAEIYRRNYGLLLWQADYDGAFSWVYQWNMGSDPWNDFDSDHYRDCNMVYPTASGVVDTIQWEGWREGVDDCRYMATLTYWIDQARQTGHNSEANAAGVWMQQIHDGGSDALKDLDALRNDMIHYIQLCKSAVDKK